MVPLMMEEGYSPSGWLGLLLGTRLYYPFHPAAVQSDAAFLKQVIGWLTNRTASTNRAPKK